MSIAFISMDQYSTFSQFVSADQYTLKIVKGQLFLYEFFVATHKMHFVPVHF